MLSISLITPADAATPNAANGGLDLVIILCCLGVLIGMVYSIKFIIERYREYRKKTILGNHAIDTQENTGN